ncbi:MAG: helix-turn-helix transcriptional regulator [Nitrospira sp.]|nr:helix-turn-helix transcriptional regulator [Nitrospira sp.]
MSKSSPSEVFSERLRICREQRDLTQADLAAESRMQPSAISHFEAGTRRPSFDNLRRLANALEVSTDYLLGRTDKIESVGATTDALFRDLSKLTSDDQDLARNFIAHLAERGKPKTK